MISDQLRRLGRQSAIYGGGTLLSRGAGLVLLPVYTRYLTPADYGVVETLLAGAAIVVTLLNGGVSSGFFRYWYEADDAAQQTRLFRTAWWFSFWSSTAGALVCLAAAGPISVALFGGAASADLVRLAALFVWGQINYEQLMALFRVEQRPVAFVIASVAASGVTVGATLVLVIGAERGAAGVLGGMVAGVVVVLVPLLVFRHRDLGFGAEWRLLRKMALFGAPLVPAGLLLSLLYFSDRFLLVQLVGADEAGQYAVAARIASALSLLFIGFRIAWPAFAYSIKDDAAARRTYPFVLTYLIYLMTWGAVTLVLLSPSLMPLIVSPRFGAAEDAVAPLAFAAVAWAAYTVITVAVSRTGRTAINWPVIAFGLIINVSLNFVLVPRHGFVGAAIANVSAYWLMFLMMVAVAHRIYPVPYQWRRVSQIVATALVVIALGVFAEPALPLAVILIVSFPLLLVPFGFYLDAERRQIGLITRRLVRTP